MLVDWNIVEDWCALEGVACYTWDEAHEDEEDQEMEFEAKKATAVIQVENQSEKAEKQR